MNDTKEGKAAPLVLCAILFMVSLAPIMQAIPLAISISIEDAPLLWTRSGQFTIDSIDDHFLSLDSDLDSRYWIVQFEGPVGEQQVGQLQSRGLKVLEYFPDYAYAVTSKDGFNDFARRIASVPGAIGYCPFWSGLKVSPLFGEAPGELLLPTEEYGQIFVEAFEHDPDLMGRLAMHTYHIEQASPTRYLLDLPVWDFLGIVTMEGVEWIEPRPYLVLANDIASGVIGVDTVWDYHGLDGTGQTGAIADTGLDTGIDDHLVTGDIHADFDNRVKFGNWAGSSPDDNYGHGTHVAGSVAGNGASSSGAIKGMAYNSSVFFQGIMDDSYNLNTPSNLSLLFKQAYDNGSRVHTNSWGASGFYGVYTSESYDVDWFMYRYPEMLILFAAGNDGWDSSPQDGKIDADSIGPPGTAKSCLTVGASENLRASGGIQSSYGSSWGYPQNPLRDDRPSNNTRGLAAFSSRGPMDDGRIKPDIVAPGTNILSTRTSLGGISGWGLHSNPAYLYMGGTSMSTPITAGAALLVRQYFNKTYRISPTGALVKATMINGATDLTPGQYGAANPTTKEINRRPDNDQGWGRVNVGNSVYPQGANLTFIDQRQGLRTGENISRIFRVLSSRELRITLAWSDYPSTTFTGKQLVNDLDLVLESPDGTKYNGNDFTAPFDSSYDSLNPVEGISIKTPLTGWWKVVVNARNVARGSQHFALVGTGDISSFVVESMGFGRGYYSTDGAEMKLQLVSRELLGLGTVTAHVNSTSDRAGRDVALIEDGNYGSFRGTLWTSNISTSDQTKLHVSHDDIIEASFVSPSLRIFSSTAIAKKPLRLDIIARPELSITFTLDERIELTGVGKPGTMATLSLPKTMFGAVPLYDDGLPIHNDEIAGDGLFGASILISGPLAFKSMLTTRVIDPFLGPLLYEQFNISVNTSLPRTPRSLKAHPLPYGNSVHLSWNKSSGSEIDHYSVFMNTTPPSPGPGAVDWALLKNTTGIENSSFALGLADGTEYSFRVASVDPNGNLSSMSVEALAVPSDRIAPTVAFSGEPFTMAGMARLVFDADPDLERLEAEYYNDTDGNGLPDDVQAFIPFYNGTSTSFDWDTREAAGGPGNLGSMILRFRGYDEVPNISPWTVLPGFSVDNIGPMNIELQTFPPRITNDPDFELIGLTEPLGKVVPEQNGRSLSPLQVGSSGIFAFSLDLEEGLNWLNLSAFDKHGAGPTDAAYRFTLDTMPPVSLIRSFDRTVPISRGGTLFFSDSYDDCLDPEFRSLGNLSWELKGPGGETTGDYGPSFRAPFKDLGDHRLELTVIDQAGNQNKSSIAFTVVDKESPQVNISGPSVMDEDTSVEFSISGSTDNDPELFERDYAKVEWGFTDGKGWRRSAEKQTISMVLPNPGSYEITLRITDRGGNIGESNRSVLVRDITPPEITIMGERRWVRNETGHFLVNMTDNDPENLRAIRPDWEMWYLDGPTPLRTANGSGNEILFKFMLAGNYTLIVSARDISGNLADANISISVREPPPAIPPDEAARRLSLIMIVLIVLGIVAVIGIISFIASVIVKRNKEIVDEVWEDEEDLDELDGIEEEEEEWEDWE